jgi:hypothetical protein
MKSIIAKSTLVRPVKQHASVGKRRVGAAERNGLSGIHRDMDFIPQRGQILIPIYPVPRPRFLQGI